MDVLACDNVQLAGSEPLVPMEMDEAFNDAWNFQFVKEFDTIEQAEAACEKGANSDAIESIAVCKLDFLLQWNGRWFPR